MFLMNYGMFILLRPQFWDILAEYHNLGEGDENKLLCGIKAAIHKMEHNNRVNEFKLKGNQSSQNIFCQTGRRVKMKGFKLRILSLGLDT